jgi:hypothetical protein
MRYPMGALERGCRRAQPSAAAHHQRRAIGSAGERLVHTEEVTGSIPVSPTQLSHYVDLRRSSHKRCRGAGMAHRGEFGQRGMRAQHGRAPRPSGRPGRHRFDGRPSPSRTRPVRRRQSVRSTVTASGRNPTAVREAISASLPTALRSAHTAVRRFARAAVPALPGHRSAAAVSRSFSPGRTARKPSSRAAGGGSGSCSPWHSAAAPPSSRTCSTPLLYISAPGCGFADVDAALTKAKTVPAQAGS